MMLTAALCLTGSHKATPRPAPQRASGAVQEPPTSIERVGAPQSVRRPPRAPRGRGRTRASRVPWRFDPGFADQQQPHERCTGRPSIMSLALSGLHGVHASTPWPHAAHVARRGWPCSRAMACGAPWRRREGRRRKHNARGDSRWACHECLQLRAPCMCS